ncbi:uncharacterized protein SEPMUDRAFT_150292 [Sphaerulina musiva SO2202]|uniref:Uncharacterized protein n=1 Tax=Sphaerulina musiva (strain SO2202) TaxID=692275 RepID=M3D1F9_SPHMS|nr:uncharacterized protein SEPMUDRAFT_150292 [Sphaerulina musiva SO2202]EMF11328.1 hypothetical protein SEPMUDRAFT_150292 [Sphaerulina musiva SO2202]
MSSSPIHLDELESTRVGVNCGCVDRFFRWSQSDERHNERVCVERPTCACNSEPTTSKRDLA